MYKRKPSPKEFTIKELYTVNDIMAYMHYEHTYNTVKRWFEKSNVSFFRVGRMVYIPINEFRLKLPVLWDSLLAAKVVRRDYGDEV